MTKRRTAYPHAFRRKMVELIRAGRTAAELSREFEPSASTIRSWVAWADRDAGQGGDGLTNSECAELRRLKRENQQLRQERKLLAKAAAWLAGETGSVAPEAAGGSSSSSK